MIAYETSVYRHIVNQALVRGGWTGHASELVTTPTSIHKNARNAKIYAIKL